MQISTSNLHWLDARLGLSSRRDMVDKGYDIVVRRKKHHCRVEDGEWALEAARYQSRSRAIYKVHDPPDRRRSQRAYPLADLLLAGFSMLTVTKATGTSRLKSSTLSVN